MVNKLSIVSEVIKEIITSMMDRVIIIGISYLKNEGGEVNERINS